MSHIKKQFSLINRLCALLLLCLIALPGAAEITFSLSIIRETKPAYESDYGPPRFRAAVWLSDTNEPLSYHRVEAPDEICSANFGTNSDYSSLVFYDAEQLFYSLTNGNWKLWLNRETDEEAYYEFPITSAALATNLLPEVYITSPPNGGFNISTNPAYTWIGPTDFDEIIVGVRGMTNATLPATKTKWFNGPTLTPGTNFFLVSYFREVTEEFTISTPTNDVLGELTNWNIGFVVLRSSAESGFLTEGLPFSPLAEALDCPELIWETFGDAEWFGQTANVTDGVDAAQSGVIPDNGYSRLRTVIYGTNTIRFRWRTDCEAFADYVEFSDNGNYVTDLTGTTVWQEYIYQITDNQPHVLEWTYYKDVSYAEGADAAFLDQVRLSADILPVGPSVEFNLTLSREQKPAHDDYAPNALFFSARPSLSATNPPMSYHEVRSPGGAFKATFGPTNTTVAATPFLDFDALRYELTNGVWILRLDRGTPQEQFYTFRLNAPTFTSNDLGGITITQPTNDAVEVLPYTSFAWTENLWAADELAVRAYQIREAEPFFYATESLSPTSLTNWIGQPPLASGTNFFEVRSTRAVIEGFDTTAPFIGWSLGEVQFETLTTASFVVASAQPVELLVAQTVGDEFQFQFLSQFGFTNLVQSCTNLIHGDWITRTNIPGDGELKTVLLPIGSEPEEYFRVITQ